MPSTPSPAASDDPSPDAPRAGDGGDPTGPASPPEDPGVVSWVALPDRESDPYFLAVRHLLAGVGGVVALTVGGLLAFLLSRSLVGPDDDVLLVVVTLALVGGPFSLVYVLLAADAGSERELALFSPDLSWLRLRWVLPGLVAAAVLLVVLLLLVGPAFVLVLPVGLALLVSAVDSRYSVGRIDPESRRLRFHAGKLARRYAASNPAVAAGTEPPSFDADDRNRRKADLSTLAGLDRYAVGSYAVLRLRYHDRDWLGNRPRLLVVPDEAAERVTDALDGIAATNEWEESEGLDRDVRLVLGALGATFLGAVGLFALVAGGEPVVVWYAAATLGLLGAAMVAAALFG
jgi:hypothetical protein